MNKLKLSGKQLRAIGYPEAPVISVAMNVMEKNYKHHSGGRCFNMKALIKIMKDIPARITLPPASLPACDKIHPTPSSYYAFHVLRFFLFVKL